MRCSITRVTIWLAFASAAACHASVDSGKEGNATPGTPSTGNVDNPASAGGRGGQGSGGTGGTASTPARDGGAATTPDARPSADAPLGAAPDTGPAAPVSSAVLTFHNDVFRTGAALGERTLDVAKVKARGMKGKFMNTVVGGMSAQPLYVPGLTVKGKTRDVVFVATMNNVVSAFDANEADSASPMSSTKLWEVTLKDPENATARPLARGIFSTPVIDQAANTMYLVFSTRNTTRDHGKLTDAQNAALNVEFFLVALDIRDGSQLRVKKLDGTFPRRDGTQLVFEARNHWCRPALLLGQGALYVACGERPSEETTLYHGWVFRYDPATLTRQGVFCTAPNVDKPGFGVGIWQSGGGLAQDTDGNVYFITANGPADFANGSYGDAMVKLTSKGGTLSVGAAFSPEGPEGKLANNDVDFGSGGALVLPNTPFVFGAGKTGIGYLFDRATIGKLQEFPAAVNQYDPTGPVDINWEGGPHVHGTPVFWGGSRPGQAYVYTWGEQDYLRRHTLDLTSGRFDPTRDVAGKVLALKATMPGGLMSLSANGTTAGTGILWATLPAYPAADMKPGGRLLAHDAETLEVIWEVNFLSLPEWMPPTIADGKVFLGTDSNQLLIYELGPAK